MFCGLVVVVVVGCEPGVVVGCEAGVVVAAMVVGLSVESSSGSGGTNRPPRVLPTNTDLEGGGSGEAEVLSPLEAQPHAKHPETQT